LLNWLVALLPLAAILYLLVGRNWKAASAAPVGFFLAVLTAFILFQAPARVVALQTVKGIWDALFILYVIVPALLLYEVSRQAGAFQAIRRGIEAYSPNELLHVLAIGWVFSSFLQGITGFGAPAAVTAPLLVAFGVRPFWAVVIALTGHTWANTFGTLGVAWEGLTAVTDMPNPAATALTAGAMLLLANLVAGLLIAWMFGRGQGLREGLPAVLIVSLIHGGGQMLLAPVAPTLANFLPSTVALGTIFLLSRSPWYRKDTDVKESVVMQEGELEDDEEDWKRRAEEAVGREEKEMSLLVALSPYLVLIVLIVAALLIQPVNQALASVRIGFPFPRLETGLGIVTGATDNYRSLAPLTHPGTFLLLSALFAFILFRSLGEISRGKMDDILVDTVRTSIPSAIALFALIPLAKVMEGTGQTLVLAQGIAAVSPGIVYAFISPLVGVLGSFMTSSNMSSNILFGPLQESTAAALNISNTAVLAAQTAGGAIGNAIAPGIVLLGSGAVGVTDRMGEIIRVNMRYVLISLALIGIVAVVASLFIA
jgi:lactate permease